MTKEWIQEKCNTNTPPKNTPENPPENSISRRVLLREIRDCIRDAAGMGLSFDPDLPEEYWDPDWLDFEEDTLEYIDNLLSKYLKSGQDCSTSTCR